MSTPYGTIARTGRVTFNYTISDGSPLPIAPAAGVMPMPCSNCGRLQWVEPNVVSTCCDPCFAWHEGKDTSKLTCDGNDIGSIGEFVYENTQADVECSPETIASVASLAVGETYEAPSNGGFVTIERVA